jgi:hypothetical protein
MASKRTVVLVCDLCEQDATDSLPVQTRQVIVDGQGVEAEVCDPCWSTFLGDFASFAVKGRPLPPRTPRLKSAKAIPGSTWRFTSHALIRCGERNMDPAEIVQAIENPTLTRPGRASDQEIRERGYIKAVVVPERGIVVTVARKGEDDAASYADVG